jgi:Fe2+ or Zn2+ uptake regulation protein
LGDDYIYHAAKKYRRKRVLEEDAIEGTFRARLEEAQRADKGLLCRNCGKWRRWHEIEFKYTAHRAGITRHLFCRRCNNMIKEDEL